MKDIKKNVNSQIRENYNALHSVIKDQYIKKVPSYANSFFFTIGVYLLEIFAILAVTGMVIMIFGVPWGSTPGIGNFVRSLHLWAAEAFVTLIFIHLFVNFSTSAFKNKKIVWIIGSIMLFLVLLEFAFGVALPGDFISQANARAGADLWNGMGLGFWINPLNYGAVLGWHIAIVPLLLILLMFAHYSIVKKRGLSVPYRKDIPYSMVNADHNAMYRRMAYIFIIIFLFAIFLQAPYTQPMTTQSLAKNSPNDFAITLLNEFNHSSTTATYLDTIDPYKFDTRMVYVNIPYLEYINTTHRTNELYAFYSENAPMQNMSINSAFAYFNNNGSIAGAYNSTDPLTNVIGTLTLISQNGLYGPILQSESNSGVNATYTLLLISDSSAFNSAQTQNGIQISQFGMLTIGKGSWQQYMAYWLIPYNLLEIATSNITWWNDLENGTLALIAFVILMFVPYIPVVRDIPDRLKLYKIFWNKYTVPEMRNTKRTKK